MKRTDVEQVAQGMEDIDKMTAPQVMTEGNIMRLRKAIRIGVITLRRILEDGIDEE